MSFPSASAPVDKRTSASVIPGDYDYSSRLIPPERVLTFNNAGLGQRSLSGRPLGLRLRGESGLLSGRCGFFSRHRCSRIIPLPRQVRRFPAEYTSRLSIKYDYHIKYYSRRINTYKLNRTTVTVGAPRILAMSTSPTSAGASSCASVPAASSTAAAAGSVLPSAAGAGAPAVPKALLRWGLGYDYPSRLPHGVPIAFVALLNGLGRWHLLQARKLRRQHTNSRHEYSATLVKTAYLLRCGLSDLHLLGHALAGHIARPPWRRGQTSL
jgi:hypothetical protein